MFDPDAEMPRLNRSLVYLGACIIAGLRLAREKQVPAQRTPRVDPSVRRGVDRRRDLLTAALAADRVVADPRPTTSHKITVGMPT